MHPLAKDLRFWKAEELREDTRPDQRELAQFVQKILLEKMASRLVALDVARLSPAF